LEQTKTNISIKRIKERLKLLDGKVNWNNMERRFWKMMLY
jgi:hypothetical protein